MSVKLLTEHHLEFLSLEGDYTGLSESRLVKMPHHWKSHVVAHMYYHLIMQNFLTCYLKFVIQINTINGTVNLSQRQLTKGLTEIQPLVTCKSV